MKYPKWLEVCKNEIIEPRKKIIESHPFILDMLHGRSEKKDAERFFSGLMWHLLDFGKHVSHLMKKRDPKVSDLLRGRSEDTDGDTEILKRIVDSLQGPSELILKSPWKYQPHPVWVTHDSLLRSAIYSTDLPWQAGTAALTIGIESLVPTMIEPLFSSATKNFGLSSYEAQWLESRSGEEEKQHGDNGWMILSEFVSEKDSELQDLCKFQIHALSYSMAYRLLESGKRKEIY